MTGVSVLPGYELAGPDSRCHHVLREVKVNDIDAGLTVDQPYNGFTHLTAFAAKISHLLRVDSGHCNGAATVSAS